MATALVPLVAPLGRCHGAVGRRLVAAGAGGRDAGPQLLEVAHLHCLIVYGGRAGDQLVVEEHGIHHGVHLDVADASAHRGHRIAANLDIFQRQRGQGAEGVEDRVLRGQGVEAAEEDR